MNDSPRRRVREARQVALEALLAFAADPDGRILTKLETHDMDPRDAALAREIALGVIRRRDLLDHICTGFTERGLPMHIEARFALRIGAYQLCFLERIPPHAAVDSSVNLCEQPSRGFVNAVLRRIAERVRPASEPIGPDSDRLALPGNRVIQLGLPLPHPERDAAGWMTVMGGIPEFLAHRWLDRHGRTRAFELVDAASRNSAVMLRTVRVTRDELAEQLRNEGVITEPADHPRVLRWTDGATPFATAAYRDGCFVAQDPTSVRAAEAVGAQRGETILDLCAAPGTKASFLAEAVGSEGKVVAADPDGRRRARIVDNVLRLRMPWIKIGEDPRRGVGADRVLADVPCSNTGVLARRVEARYRLTAERINELVATQREILAQALELVRPSGTVVYSTCSIEQEENHDVVAPVAREWQATIVAEHTTWPDPPHHDGGYFAILRAPD